MLIFFQPLPSAPNQTNLACLQHSHWLYHCCHHHVELWYRRFILHPLERSFVAAAGLPHCDQLSGGPHVHQVSARLDHLDRAGHHGGVGSVILKLYRSEIPSYLNRGTGFMSGSALRIWLTTTIWVRKLQLQWGQRKDWPVFGRSSCISLRFSTGCAIYSYSC